MTVKIKGHSTLTGKPETIIRLLNETIGIEEQGETAEATLRMLAEKNIITIEE